MAASEMLNAPELLSPTDSMTSRGISDSLGGGGGVLVQDFDGLAPRVELGGVELAEVEDLALYDFAAGAPPVLDDVVVGELSAVFFASVFL